MGVEVACRAPGCNGVARPDVSGEFLQCGACGRRYRYVRKPPRAATAGAVPAAPSPTPAEPDAPDGTEVPAEPRRPRRKRRKRRAESGGGLLGSFAANMPFLLTRVAPAVLVVGGLLALAAYLAVKKKHDQLSAQLAQQLWSECGGLGDLGGLDAIEPPPPYVRGQLAIVETQARVKSDHRDDSRPEHWLNDYIEPPLEDPAAIGSVILVEWQVVEDAARNASGQALGLSDSLGRPTDGDPVMLKRWNCVVKLIDRKRRAVVYQTRLLAADRTFQEGQRVLTTPGTVVPPERLAGEFEKIRRFRQIGLEGEPPAAEPAK
jgi:hypothetical protein